MNSALLKAVCNPLPLIIHLLGYYTDEQAFLQRVEEDAESFRPPGQFIYSYTRPSPNSASKGKRKRTGTSQALNAADEDVVEYEVYHVNIFLVH